MDVSTSAIDCLERLVPEMMYYVSSGSLNSTNSLIYSVMVIQIFMRFSQIYV